MLTRRQFLTVASRALLGLSGALGLGGLVRYLSYTPPPPPPKRYPVGPESNFLPNSRTVVPAIPALLIRTRDEFRAVSLSCTHLGCTVAYKAETFTCACHGSRYDKAGNVVRGPAVAPLTELQVERTESGEIVIVV